MTHHFLNHRSRVPFSKQKSAGFQRDKETAWDPWITQRADWHDYARNEINEHGSLGTINDAGGTGHKQRPDRVCAKHDCTTQLSNYNPGTRCSIHE